MKLNKGSAAGALIFYVVACGSTTPAAPIVNAYCGQTFQPLSYPMVGTWASGGNVVPVTVNGTLCGTSTSQFPNKLCTSVRVCAPTDPTNCTDVDNIYLDSGSVGFRMFASALGSIPLVPLTVGTSTLAECYQYAGGSSEWGPVKEAYIGLGNEPLVAMPIMVIDQGYGTPPAPCTSAQSVPDTSPNEAGFNGILGIGLFPDDCGDDCVNDAANGQYFSCAETNCACGTAVALGAQVQNPVALLPVDNNGVIFQLPSVGGTGAASISGSLILGIDTQSNNASSGVTLYEADDSGNFKTLFSAYSPDELTSSFIDSGSSILYFPDPTGGGLPICSTSYGVNFDNLYCPTSSQSYTAQISGARGGQSATVAFQVGNAFSLETGAPKNMVFSDVGSSPPKDISDSFDWGLPFFMGRNVFVGIYGTASKLGTGPYWAF